MTFIHSLEIPAVLLVLTTTYLVARDTIWNWLVGMVAVSLYVVIFFKARLYGVMSLQLVFLASQFYGLYGWLYGGRNHTPLAITRVPASFYGVIFVVAIILFLMSLFLLRVTHSNLIEVDALVTALSLVAQGMMCKKWIEHWLVWMVSDLTAVGLYWFKQLYVTGGLYVFLFLLCCYGYAAWRKKLNPC